MAAPPTRLKPAQIARTSKIARPFLDIRIPVGFVNAMEIIPQEVPASVLDRRLPRIPLLLRRGSPIRRDNPGIGSFRARACKRLSPGRGVSASHCSVFRIPGISVFPWVVGSGAIPGWSGRLRGLFEPERRRSRTKTLARPPRDRQHESWRRSRPAEREGYDLRRAIGLLRSRSSQRKGAAIDHGSESAANWVEFRAGGQGRGVGLAGGGGRHGPLGVCRG